MDTTFWGPDGWMLLHTITYFLPEKLNSKEQQLVKSFYENISKILPCKYCRISNQKYMKSLPIAKYYHSRDKLNLWIYLLHNKVNNKLRRQGYCIYDNPKFEDINSRYHNLKLQYVNETSKSIRLLICNKFIGSIIFNFPNYLTNCNEQMKYQDLIKLYYNFFNQLTVFSGLINSECSIILKKYLLDNDLKKVLKYDKQESIKNKIYLSMDLNSKLKLYEWYFNLCKIFIVKNDNIVFTNLSPNLKKNNNSKKNKKNKVSRKELNGFCNQFNKYIVKTCSDPKLKKTKKNQNTCRKLI